MKEINAKKDILLGRGPLCYRNPGNVVFRNMIQIHVVKYALDAPRSVKRAIVQSLIQEAHEQGRRFLARSTTTTTTTTSKTKTTESILMNTTTNTTTTTETTNGTTRTMENENVDVDDDDWCEASPKLIRSKVSHALRDARNSVNLQLQQQLQQQQQQQQQKQQQQQQKLQSNQHQHHHPYHPKAIQKYMRLSHGVSDNYRHHTYEYENYNHAGQFVRHYNPSVSMRRPMIIDSHGHCATRQTATYNNTSSLLSNESHDSIDTPSMTFQIVHDNNKRHDSDKKEQTTSSVNQSTPKKRIHPEYWNRTADPYLEASTRDGQQQQHPQQQSSSSSLSTPNIGWDTDSQDVVVYAIALLELWTSKQHTHQQPQQQQQNPLGTQSNHSNISK